MSIPESRAKTPNVPDQSNRGQIIDRVLTDKNKPTARQTATVGHRRPDTHTWRRDEVERRIVGDPHRTGHRVDRKRRTRGETESELVT